MISLTLTRKLPELFVQNILKQKQLILQMQQNCMPSSKDYNVDIKIIFQILRTRLIFERSI